MAMALSSVTPVGLGVRQPLLRISQSSSCRRMIPARAAVPQPQAAQRSEGRTEKADSPQTGLVALRSPLFALLAVGSTWMASPMVASAAEELAAASSSGFDVTTAGMEVLVYLAKTLISWGVPGAISIIIVLLATSRSKQPADKDDTPAFMKMFNKEKTGEPKEYLKIQPMNERLDSFSYSLTKATDSKAKAAADRRKKTYTKKFRDFVGDLSDESIEAVLKAEETWKKEAERAQTAVNEKTRQLRALTIKETKSSSSDSEEKGGMGSMFGGGDSGARKDLNKALAQAVEARSAADDKYLRSVSKVLTTSQQESLTRMIKEKTTPGWQDSEDLLALAPVGSDEAKQVFVLKFNGDVQASQVKNLRQEVTAIIRNARKDHNDEVVLVLNTGGGTVTGYGLAAAQLNRIKEAGLKLTICVEQVAASGGYMMACCADRIVASPFAVLGSIGVISEQPNVYDRLKKEGIEFQTVTAGKYKRTLTPFKKPTEEDFDKSKADIEQVLVLFKDFVATNRPQLDIDTVATGETWFGPDALARGLVDELKTADDVLLEFMEAGADVFSVAFSEPPSNPLAAVLSPAGQVGFLPALMGAVEAGISAAVGRQLSDQRNGSTILAKDPSEAANSVKAQSSEDPTDLWFL